MTNWRGIVGTWDIGDAELAEWARTVLGIYHHAEMLRFMVQLQMVTLRTWDGSAN